MYIKIFSQVTYQETFNGDSSNVFVEEPEFSLLNLQPGRNYSVGVQAVAKGIESVGKSINVATRKKWRKKITIMTYEENTNER